AIGGSILAGLGIGLILSNGYSFIGTIGLAEIITKKLEVSPGKGILMVESGVIVVGTLVIGIEQAMVSAIALYLLSKMVQSITYGMYQYKQVLIVSPELDHIKNRLTREISENSSVLIAQNAAREEEQNLL
ncbi:MAG: hypothetical protein GWN00_22245, partial [Aliifodinibius sp.]|nr:YitT family protein [Fodinibius sp.]NIV13682.1 hypothetical protein [Fodinibius sp.]NIY27424.1 hypothetical protein [Fodinibius sp.]